MGQLTNQFVSQSYQGLLNLENANTGITATLQYVTDGVGNRLPMLASTSSVVITGSFRGDGSGLTGVTTTLPSGVVSGSVQIVDLGFATTSSLDTLSGSIAVTDLAQNNRLTSLEQFTGSIDTGYVSEAEFGTYTSSMNNFTSSIDSRVDALEIETGSLQNQINQKLDTGSFNTYTSSVNTKLAGLDIETGSLQNQINGLATTGSLSGYTTITAFNNYTSSNDTKVNNLTSKTGSYATTGSNQFNGNQSISGSVQASSTVTSLDGFVGGYFGSNVNNTLYGDQLVDIKTQTTGNNGKVRLYSNGNYPFRVQVTGSLDVTGTITATSASFTYVNTVYETASVIYSSGSNQFGDASNDTQTLFGTVNLPSGPLVITGSVTSTGGFTGSLQGTASNAISSSHAINADTASFVQNAISSSYATNAATASIAYDVVVYGKCDNPGGLTRGTIVRITGANGDNPLFNTASWEDDANSANTLGMLSEDVAYNAFANVVVQGKVIGINTVGMNAGDLLFLSSSGQYTTSSVPAPYHEVRLGQVLRPNLNNGSAYVTIDNGYELTELHDVDIQSVQVGDVLTYVSGAYGQWVNKTVDELGYLQTSSFNTYTASMDARTGSYATTGSNIFLGTETITGSINVSGSANFVGDVSLNLIEPNDFKQNLVLLGGKNQLTSSTVLNNYLNAVTTSLDNDDVNFGLIPGGSLVPASGISTITGSIFISGSNNFILNLGSQAPASQGRRGIVGNANFVQSAIPAINTSSLTIPAINNNYFGSSLSLTLTTGSNLGNNAHSFNSNILLGAGMTFNHPSASIGAGVSTNVSANLNIGLVTSNSSGSLLTTQTTFNNNLNLHPGLVLNHISSSIQSTNNFFIGGATMNINNRYFNTGSNNSVAVSANILTGQNTVVNLAGSPSTNVSRTLVGNLVGGQNNNLSLEQTGTDLGGLRNSVVFGHNLNVTGSHSAAGPAQGAAFLGRYNGEDNGLADSARTILAVGTGTGASNRRTGFYITSGSLVGVSGSMDIKGVTNALVVTGSATIQHSVAGQPALTLVAQSIGQPALLVSGTFNVTGSGDHNIIGNSTTITGSVRLSNVMNLQPLDPLPAGNIGDLAVSSSNQLYFYNGAWTLVV